MILASGLHVNMVDWNPYLVAVAFKRFEILKTLLNSRSAMSIKGATRDPSMPIYPSFRAIMEICEQQYVEAESFGLRVCVYN